MPSARELPSEVELRAAGPGDVDAVTRLVQVAYEPYVSRIGRRPAPMDADYQAAVDAGRVWVAELDGTIIGLLVLEIAADHALVENVAVSPDVQGRGVGSALLAFAELEADRRGLDTVRLYTNVAMTENIAYYRRRGYQETHRVDADGFGRVFLAKRCVPGVRPEAGAAQGDLPHS